MPGLGCCVGFLYEQVQRAGAALQSQCAGILLRRLLLLQSADSRCCGLSSCISKAQWVCCTQGLSCSWACEIFLDQALIGMGFLSPGPPEKPLLFAFNLRLFTFQAIFFPSML